MILRAKTENLIQTRPLTEERQKNTSLNKAEINNGAINLASYPQRLVFEMTNACNLNCVMCGRNARHFKPVNFNFEWLKKFEFVSQYVEEVTLMGWGEPTMHPQFLQFLEWAEQRKMRKYFCTNGMKLGEIQNTIFELNVDVIAISMDAASGELNNQIRRGADFEKINKNLKNIVAKKQKLNSQFPYMNFVTTLMKKNLREFPKIVELAADIGLQECKAVFLTIFDNIMKDDSLYDSMDEVRDVFDYAAEIATKNGILLKLPHLRGQDPAGDLPHKPCRAAWRDFFLGSDGFVRPCMSTPLKLFHIDKYNSFAEMWNSAEFLDFRKKVNDKDLMDNSCKRCYQSSFANWNKKSSFYQIGTEFSPEWKVRDYTPPIIKNDFWRVAA